jgi:drug/metabolite transporter (DMT)-like permease
MKTPVTSIAVKPSKVGIFALILTAISYTLMVIPTRNLPEVNSFFLVWTAFLITGLVTGILAAYKNPKFLQNLIRNDYKIALGLSVMHVLSTICLNMAVKLTDLSVAGLLLYTAPLWVFLISVYTKKVAINLKNVSLILLSVSSTLLIIDVTKLSFEIGVILGLLSGIFYTFDFIFGEKLLQEYDGLEVTAFAHITGAIILLPAIWASPDFNLFSLTDYFWLFSYGGLLTVSFLLFMYGVKRVTAFYSSIITLLEPVLLFLLGLFLYNEVPTLNVAIGGVLVLVCIYLVQQESN